MNLDRRRLTFASVGASLLIACGGRVTAESTEPPSANVGQMAIGSTSASSGQATSAASSSAESSPLFGSAGYGASGSAGSAAAGGSANGAAIATVDAGGFVYVDAGLSEPLELDLVNRWNAAATAAGTTLDFHWTRYDQFPHPTYKGGTAGAYGEFASVLLLFFQQGDNFHFLASAQLFSLPLLYVFPSGQVGLNTTFKQMTSELSSSTGFGNQSAATRQALAGYLAQMP